MSLRVSPRRVSVLACTALLGCLPVAFASAQASPPSTLALRVGDSTAATQHGTGAFTDLTVTVSQTEHLRNQVVTVSWTGGTPTSANGFRSDYLQIMQCWGDEAAPVREKCQFGADWQSLDQYSGNTKRRTIQNLATISDPNEEIVPELGQSQYIPFQGVGGTIVTDPNKNDLFNIYDTNELAYSRTAADGTGTAFFEVQTQAQSAGLGCGTRQADGTGRSCWLVVVPRSDREVNGKTISELTREGLWTSPLSASNFANALAFRLKFEPLGVNCPLTNARQIEGHEEIINAMSRWQPKLCDQTGQVFNYAQVTDDNARLDVVGDEPWLSIVGEPVAADLNPDGRKLTYAPLSIEGLGIGIVIERTGTTDVNGDDPAPPEVKAKYGSRVTDVKLTPRLVAKLLTQSYRRSVPGINRLEVDHLAGNPNSLAEDEEFLTLNPEFRYLTKVKPFAITNPSNRSDAFAALWRWIRSDQSAREFVGGKSDQWGTKVNPFYKGMNLDLADFPRLDPTCQQFFGGDSGKLCSLQHLNYASDLNAAGQAAARGSDLSMYWQEGVPEAPGKYVLNPPMPPGGRSLLVLLDSAGAARFNLPMARLKNANGDFVGPDNAGLQAGLKAMKPTEVAGVSTIDPVAKVPDAYPLTQISYAVTAPRELDQDAADDYAEFIRYAAGDGQVPGIASGQLPGGYLPLTPALRAQALAAAADIEERGGPTASPSPSPSPSASPSSTPTPAAPTPVPTVPAGPVPSLAAPSQAPTPKAPLPTAPAGDQAPVSLATPETPMGRNRWALVAALLVGILAGVARPVVPWWLRRRGSH